MKTNKKLLLFAFLFLFFFVSCKTYKHSNPLDPKFDGIISRDLKIDSFEIDDTNGQGHLSDIFGNGDGIINQNEKVVVFVKTINLGNSIEKNVVAVPSLITNQNIRIFDYFLQFDNILPNQISFGGEYNYKDNIRSAFVGLEIDKSVPHNSKFKIELAYPNAKDTIDLICERIGANLISDGILIENETPDHYSYYFALRFKIKNSGSSPTKRVSIVNFSSLDKNIRISYSDEESLGDLNVAESKYSNYYRNSLSVSKQLAFPYNSTITIQLEDAFENIWEIDYDLILEP